MPVHRAALFLVPVLAASSAFAVQVVPHVVLVVFMPQTVLASIPTPPAAHLEKVGKESTKSVLVVGGSTVLNRFGGAQYPLHFE